MPLSTVQASLTHSLPPKSCAVRQSNYRLRIGSWRLRLLGETILILGPHKFETSKPETQVLSLNLFLGELRIV